MSTPGGFDPRNDPTAPSYEAPSYEAPPTYEAPPPYGAPPPYEAPPTYGAPTYGPPTYDTPSLEKAPAESPSSAWPPPQPADPVPYPPTPGQAPGFPPHPGGPGGRSKGAGLAIALGAVVLLVLAAVGIGVVFLTRGDDTPSAAPARPSPSAAATSGSSRPSGTSTGSTTPSGSSSPSGAAQVMVPAVTPGFQGVLSPKENVAYDVPDGWEVRTPGTLVGFEDADGNPLAIMHGVSTYRRGACPDVQASNRGNAGFQTAGSADPAQAAQGSVQTFAGAAALNDDGTTAPVTAGPVQDVTVGQGTIAAKLATATVTPPAGAACGAPTILFTAVAFTTPGGGTAVFMMYLDQGTSDALSPALAQQIVASLRPYTG